MDDINGKSEVLQVRVPRQMFIQIHRSISENPVDEFGTFETMSAWIRKAMAFRLKEINRRKKTKQGDE
jgi:hypothetical protein